MVEGARLESVFRGNSNVGSNPTLSAIVFSFSAKTSLWGRCWPPANNPQTEAKQGSRLQPSFPKLQKYSLACVRTFAGGPQNTDISANDINIARDWPPEASGDPWVYSRWLQEVL